MGSAYQIKDHAAAHYLTFQVVGWADIFSRQVYRDIVHQSFQYCRKERGLELFAYVIMTNHVHTIMRSKLGGMSGLVRDIKKHTSKEIIKEIQTSNKESRREWLEMVFRYHAKYNKRAGDKQLWTHENHAVEMATNEIMDSRVNYIHDNPVRAGWVSNPEDYLHSACKKTVEFYEMNYFG